MSNVEIELLKHQSDFMFSTSKFHLLVTGIGAGKTFAGDCWVVKKVKENPETLGIIAANTYGQLRNVMLRSLFSLLEDCGIDYNYNGHTKELKFMGATILCLSLDNFNAHRGIEAGWFWLDEVRDTSQEAFDMLMGRLRCKKSIKLEGRLTSTPVGYNWLYDYFVGSKKTKDFTYTEATTYDNHHLPEGFVDSLVSQYDDKFLQQEVYGKFLSLTSGKVYYAFDRKINVAEIKDFNGAYWLACDFNVNPLCAVRGLVNEHSIYITDEIYLKDSNTFALADTIKKDWGTGLRIVPDSTGNSRRTSSAKSDHQILRDAGLQVIYNHNPLVKDRQNCVNNLLNKKRLTIHPKCKWLIKDLEQLLHDNKDESLSHISDALGYLSWYLMPIQKPVTPTQIIGVRR